MEAVNDKKNASSVLAFEEFLDSDSSNEEEGPSMGQQFSVDLSKKSLIPVKVEAVVTPSEFIVELESNRDVLDRIEPHLGNNWHEEIGLWDHEKHPLKRYTPVVIESIMMCDEKLVRALTNFQSEMKMKANETKYVRGTVLRSLTTEGARFYEVFLSDFGEIRKVVSMGIVKTTNEDLLNIPPAYALVKVPGLVARKRMDKIPGLAKMNIHASSWSKEAYSDFESWLSKHHTILLDLLKSDTNDIWYGDLLGTLEQDGSTVKTNQTLSSHLIESKHGFIDYTVLSRINDDES